MSYFTTHRVGEGIEVGINNAIKSGSGRVEMRYDVDKRYKIVRRDL